MKIIPAVGFNWGLGTVHPWLGLVVLAVFLMLNVLTWLPERKKLQSDIRSFQS